MLDHAGLVIRVEFVRPIVLSLDRPGKDKRQHDRRSDREDDNTERDIDDHLLDGLIVSLIAAKEVSECAGTPLTHQ